jgi:hypothetical protein
LGQWSLDPLVIWRLALPFEKFEKANAGLKRALLLMRDLIGLIWAA